MSNRLFIFFLYFCFGLNYGHCSDIAALPKICGSEFPTEDCTDLTPHQVELPEWSVSGILGLASGTLSSLSGWFTGNQSADSSKDYSTVFEKVQKQYQIYRHQTSQNSSCRYSNTEGLKVFASSRSKTPCPQAGFATYAKVFTDNSKGSRCQETVRTHAQEWTQGVLGGNKNIPEGVDLWKSRCSDPNCSLSPLQLIKYEETPSGCSITEILQVQCESRRESSEGWIAPFVLHERRCQQQTTDSY